MSLYFRLFVIFLIIEKGYYYDGFKSCWNDVGMSPIITCGKLRK